MLVGKGVSVTVGMGVLVGMGVSVGVAVGVLVGTSAGTVEVSKDALKVEVSEVFTSLATSETSGAVETSLLGTEAEAVEEIFCAPDWEANVGAVSKDSDATAMATEAKLLDVGVRVGKGVRVSVGRRVRMTWFEADRELVSIKPQASEARTRKIAAKKGNRRRGKGLLSWTHALGLHCLDTLVCCCIV